ncbi:uncharacterized protein LOC109858715 [Pseudomyrmex gracilis]|uniref:uncharacterized protein LOC109858715 n=1 Tax=Pseudomyrmex gracilis TaxID=219809 RepID=UPI000995656C|nr:uncharacterized protein LOC109858715 [Pseudomyrmex gracilis]
MAQSHQSHQHEFLPLCDVLFNIISLASYFCDVVFDFAMVYALAHQTITPPILFPLSITFIVTSLIISQIVSLRWYLWGARGKLTKNTLDDCDVSPVKKIGNWTVGCVLLLHSTQIGVLWRYFKLFIPVNLTYVKHEVRELCVLRLIHAFCEAAPMLLLQLYVLLGAAEDGEIVTGKPKENESKDGSKLAKLTLVSAGLSLWSVCWAVASFSKGAARLRNLERLVLTWLGVLAQLFWRLGTVSARVGALVAYASLYGGQWLLIVMALHWLSMLTWLLLTPDGLFHGGERLPLLRKTFLASVLAFVYIFAYVNLHETNHRQKMVIFYTVMFLENGLLVGVWMAGVNRADLLPHQHHLHPVTLVLVIIALFFGGMFFMGLYYRFFHVRRLRYEAGGRMTGSNLTTLSNQDNVEEKQADYNEEKKVDIGIGMRKMKLSNGGIPGVFNCRFANPTAVNPNRKKKKPTTFVPPPPPQSQTGSVMSSVTAVGDSKQWLNVANGSRQLIPFWKKPISSFNIVQSNVSNEQKDETDMAVGGSLNVTLIREKLKEKKQQQLRELRAIQEEIKEGKLFPPPSASTSSFSSSPSASNQQPPPNTKLHTSPSSPLFTSTSIPEQTNGGALSSWPPVKMHCLLPPPPSSPYYPNQHPSNLWRAAPQRERADTPEILLAPRCLSHQYSHWSPPGHIISHRLHANQNGIEESSKGEGEGEAGVSDMEGSQVSLPRSYTLPREFKYNHPSVARERRAGNNKLLPSRFYLPSTNSSDGDVDSADNEDETDSEAQIRTKITNHHHEILQRGHVYENNERSNDNLNSNCDAANVAPSNCYPNNSYSALRPSQLFRTRVKHETKL